MYEGGIVVRLYTVYVYNNNNNTLIQEVKYIQQYFSTLPFIQQRIPLA